MSKKTMPRINDLVKNYNDVLSNSRHKKKTSIEFEIRFDIYKKHLTAQAFQRAFDELISQGFQINRSWYSLRPSMHKQNTGPTDNEEKIRIEIDNLIDIQELCKYSSKLPEDIHIMKKRYATIKSNGGKTIKKCLFDNTDYDFRISIQEEEIVDQSSQEGEEIKSRWGNSLKSFRYINRTSLLHEKFPNIRVDLSKVKMNDVKHKDFIASGVLDAKEVFEIEIELIDINKSFDDTKKQFIETQLKQVIMFILVSVQGTPFPVEYRRMNNVNIQYLKLLKIKPGNTGKYRKMGKNFIGPSSLTLQPINLVNDPKQSISNICIQREHYCVTDKADGDRKLLFIGDKDLRLYFISSNFDITFTGLLLKKEHVQYANTIIDGEFITEDKHGRPISLFAAFDIYFVNGRDKRSLMFKDSTNQTQDRHSLLTDAMNYLSENCVSVLGNDQGSNLQLIQKRFYFSNPSDKNSLFTANRQCFNMLKEHVYNTDGFIFTPMTLGVGKETPNDTIKDTKYTWAHSFKWKPPEYNTIDFLISFNKRDDNENGVKEKLLDGDIVKYQEIILKVGVNKQSHGLTGSQRRILNEDYVYLTSQGKDSFKDYNAEPFYPTSPSDKNAHLCHILLHSTESGMKMFTEENEAIDDDIVVEFRYDINSKNKMNAWIPLRVRYDKTAEYVNSGRTKGFGNAYHVANSNWQSIHQPVTKEMLIKTISVTTDSIMNPQDDVYYNRDKNNIRKVSQTYNLRTFHNSLKESLINYCAGNQENTTLVDLAVGKGGDLYKWVKNDVKAVLGIDLSEDNIHNPHDGACKRYIELFSNKKHKVESGLIAMFISGDTSKNIENGEFDIAGGEEPTSKYIIDTLMGHDNIKQENVKEKFLSNHYGIFKEKFDICSIQFAIHYMFESERKLHSFIQNVSDLTHIGSYFIGTCYDGKSVYETLKENNGSVELHKNKNKIWGIKQKYIDDVNDDFVQGTSDSLGYKISVYQESINQEIDEYLVNFEYFEKIMEEYGFKRDTDFKIQNSSLKSINNFESFYDIYKSNNIDNRNKNIAKMSEEEQVISFLNKYFVFKKVRDIIIPPGDKLSNTEDVYSDSKSIVGRAVKLTRSIRLTQL
tara:strand:- start:1533 stop:4844 length:3312 start_codon:yes stop_codon:yes gene_type:complete